MVRKFLPIVDSFFRNHWIGILVVAIVTGVLGNFTYDSIKPKEPSLPSASNKKVDPQFSAQAMRTAASSLRAIAANHIRTPPPAKWQEAEQLYESGRGQYARGDFLNAFNSFDAAYRLYQDIYEQASYEKH